MTDNETRRHEMFLRVEQIGKDEVANFASNSFVTDLYNSLSQVIKELGTHASTQASGRATARQGTKSKAIARDELERDLNLISRTARGMARTIHGLEQKFRLPRALKDQDLIAVARMFATDAQPLKAEFIKRGLPANFLEDLNDDIAAFEEAITQRTQGTSTQVTSTAAIDGLIEKGMEIVRELDPVMRNMFDDNPGKLAAWLSASRVERAPRSKATQQPAQTQTQPTA